MCTEECMRRIEKMEVSVNSIINDLQWMRWLVRVSIVVIGAALGIDLSGMV